jgi:phage gp46-like protein
MIDISLTFNPEIFEFDLCVDGVDERRDLQGDDGLLTAVIISLFTDRRANPDDPLPDERVGVRSDLRGWWGDRIAAEDRADPMGSRLWLLSREKDLDVVVERARQYADEALQWMLRDRLVARVVARASRVAPAYLGIGIEILPLPGTDDKTREWNFLYDYINAAPLKLNAPGV